MFLFKCVYLVSLINISVLSVSHSLYNVVDIFTKHHNNSQIKTLENIWKTDEGSPKSTPTANSRSPTYPVPFLSRTDTEASNTKSSFLAEGKNDVKNSRNRRIIDINNNDIINSSRESLMKQKRRVLNHANNLRLNLNKEYNKQRSLSKDIGKIKLNAAKNIYSNKMIPKFIHIVKPNSLKTVQPSQNVGNSKLTKSAQRQTLKSSNVHWGNVTNYFPNCTKENYWCGSVRKLGNRRRDKIVFDYEKSLKNVSSDISNSSIKKLPHDMGLEFESTNKSHVVKKVLQNVSTAIPESSIKRVSNDITLEVEDVDNYPHVVKERDMLDKFFNSGNSNRGDKTGARYESYERHENDGKKENKQGALKAIADKLKYVFPFLSGFGKGVKKVLLKPKLKPANHQIYKYDSKLGMFYSLSQKPKPLFYPSPVVVSPKKPILLSDLLKASATTKIKGIPVPYNVEVEKRIPYFIKVPYDNPVPVHISQPYGVPVEKIVPYPVRVEVPEPYPVTKLVKKPYNVYVENPVPVEIEQPYPLLKEQVKPYTIETVVNTPYLDPVYNDYTVALPYDKNIPYPVTVDTTNEHKNTLTDLNNEPLQPNEEYSPSDDTYNGSDSELNPSVQQASFVSVQKHTGKPNCNNADAQDSTNEQKINPYYYSGNKSPKSTKFIKSSVPTTYAEAMKAFMKIKGNGITEVQFLDLMKQGQTRDTMKQNQLLNDAVQRTLLHRQNMQALMKQNQLLKASLARGQIKLKPQYQIKEVYPEFKPLNSNFNIPVLQNDKYNFNNNNEIRPHLSQLSESFTQKAEALQSYNQSSYYSKLLENYQYHQNTARKPKTKDEIIDEHLRQLNNPNKNNNVEVHVSDSFSYKLPDSNSLSSYYNQGDSESGFSMQQNVYDDGSNTVLQDNDLYRLQLEYKILDNLMKNINDTKGKNKPTPTSGYDENLVKTFNTKNIQLLKFAPNESISNVKNHHASNKKPLYFKDTVLSGDKESSFQEVNNLGQTEKYNGSPASWANLNQLNNMDNYTFYLASVIKDYYLKNNNNYGHHTKNNEMEVANSQNINDILSENIRNPISKQDPDNGEKTVNIGNRYNLKLETQSAESNAHSGLQSYSNNVKQIDSNNKLIEELLRNGMGTYKPIYNSDSKSPSIHAVENQPLAVNVVKFPSKSVPFQVMSNENHKKAVHFGIDLLQNGPENKTEKNPYDFEIGGFDDSDVTTTENYMSFASNTNPDSDDTVLARTEYDNYQGYYKKPLKKWTFNNTDEFKKNSAINFGKLTDFLDIVKHNLPEDETPAQKKKTSEKLKNAIFNDIQQHFETTTEDMSAESSYFIESKAQIDETPHKRANEFAFPYVKNKTNSLITKYDQMAETEHPIQSALLSTNVPEVVTHKNEQVELGRRKGSVKPRRNETVSTIETTISAYSNIRRGKDIVSNRTGDTPNQDIPLYETKNKSEGDSKNEGDFSARSDVQSRTLPKKDSREKMIRGITKISSSKKNSINSEGLSEKVAIVTPVKISSVDQKNESSKNESKLSEAGFQIFDLFNTIGNAINEMHERNSNLENFEVTEKRDVTSKTISSTSLPTTSTASTILTTIQSQPKITENSTKSKSVRGRGSVKASTITAHSEQVHFNLKALPVAKNNSTNESVINDKGRREQEVDSLPSLWEGNVLSHKSVRNETNDILSTHNKKETTKMTEKHTDPAYKKPGSLENLKDLKKSNTTHKINHKNSVEIKTRRIFPLEHKASSTSTTTSIAPTPERVTVKTVQHIERVKIKNHIKQKLESTTKKNLPKFHDYKNSSDILERRKKNMERFMFGFMMTTPEAMTEVSV